MPSVPDFETLFSQVQLFISTCNGEHIRYATDTCKLIILSLPECISVCSVYIFNILLLFLLLLHLVAGLCHQLTNALVERKQVRNVVQVFIVLLKCVFDS